MNDDPENKVRVLEHDADGIQELDNLLPRWWVWLFWGCNVFAVGYMLYFHVFNLGDLQAGEEPIQNAECEKAIPTESAGMNVGDCPIGIM